ncbi:Imm1 family immunity protein [Mesorhizobium sp.]|uniref:Imm1 family immunity protein n=1 Tax=Mesorhizobium sp. TaxID=1871066 RepID=UPI003BACFB4E
MSHPNFIVRAVIDDWHGNLLSDEEVLVPSIEVISDLVGLLNADDRTIVSLFGRNGSSLTIGGGGDRYIVFVSTPDENLWNLTSERSETEKNIVLKIGGQEGDFSTRQIIDRTLAMYAIRSFFTDGTLQPADRWEKQT